MFCKSSSSMETNHRGADGVIINVSHKCKWKRKIEKLTLTLLSPSVLSIQRYYQFLCVSWHIWGNCSLLHKISVSRCHQHLCLGTLAPARELPGDSKSNGNADLEAQLMHFLTNLNLIVPVVAALAVIIIAIIVICVLKGRNNNISKGMYCLRNPCSTFWWHCQQCWNQGWFPWLARMDWFEHNRPCQCDHHCRVCRYTSCMRGSFKEERSTYDESRLTLEY